MRYFVAFSLIFTSTQLFSQSEGNMWFFGNNAGVDFNSGLPVSVNGGQTTNFSGYSEGVAAISDDQGNLIMYTNGETIWNRNHQIMPNGSGLNGSFSSTQSSIIIPQPKSKNLYYVFTMDDIWESTGGYGLQYSIVDMCLDNGNGSVLSNAKNVPIQSNVFEKIAAVRHANGIDFWIVIHKLNTNEYYSYLLSGAGIAAPIVSSVGSNSIYGQGQMKFSPDGSKMAVAHNQHYVGQVIFELFNFDNITGQLSNPIALSTSNYFVFGVEFSPNSQVLYATYSRFTPVSELSIMQFDISSGDSATINNSQTIVYSALPISLRGLQIAPNDRIYMVAIPNDGYLLSINNPNALGSNCNVIDNDIFLNGNTGDKTLPSFVAGFSYDNSLTFDCTLSLEENNSLQEPELVKILDLMGRETVFKPNTHLVYIYSDGTTKNIFQTDE